MKYKLDYYSYWKQKGEYGLERIKRMVARKKGRRKSFLCPKCHGDHRESWHTCPYRTDMADDYETKCRCCSYCQKDCAGDI